MLPFGLNACFCGIGGPQMGIGEYGNVAVGFQDGILHRLQVQHILLPQMARQFIQGDAGTAQIFLQNMAVFHKDHRFSTEQFPEKYAAHRKPGQHQLHAQHR